MKVRTIVLTLALCLVGVPMGFAQDAFMGVWKLKEAKSEFSPGAPKNTTVVYEAEGDKVKVTVDSVSSDGKPTHNEWTGKFDGKDNPVKGNNPDADTMAFSKIDARTYEAISKKGGKTTLTARIAVAADGKTRITTQTGKDGQGQTVNN